MRASDGTRHVTAMPRTPSAPAPKTWPAGHSRGRGKGVAIPPPAASRLGQTWGPRARNLRGTRARAGAVPAARPPPPLDQHALNVIEVRTLPASIRWQGNRGSASYPFDH